MSGRSLGTVAFALCVLSSCSSDNVIGQITVSDGGSSNSGGDAGATGAGGYVAGGGAPSAGASGRVESGGASVAGASGGGQTSGGRSASGGGRGDGGRASGSGGRGTGGRDGGGGTGAASGGQAVDAGSGGTGGVSRDAGLVAPGCTSGVFEQCWDLACPSGQVCLQVTSECGALTSQMARCIDDPCAGASIDCAGCAARVCSSVRGPFTYSCSALIGRAAGGIGCSGGGVCASPDTRIATPAGDVPIAALEPGDLVYSRSSTGIEVVPLLAVVSRPVRNHRAVRIVFADGGELFVSGPHPTADGRRLGALRTGDLLDGRRIVRAEYEPYPYASTYDVLPASESGTYVANGVWLGSTL